MTKQVALADDAYELLDQFRGPSESFSDVVRRWGAEARRKALLDSAGAWSWMTEQEAQRITDEIRANRRASRTRKVPEL